MAQTHSTQMSKHGCMVLTYSFTFFSDENEQALLNHSLIMTQPVVKEVEGESSLKRSLFPYKIVLTTSIHLAPRKMFVPWKPYYTPSIPCLANGQTMTICYSALSHLQETILLRSVMVSPILSMQEGRVQISLTYDLQYFA